MHQLIKPYGDGLETENKKSTEQKLSLQGRQMEKVEYGVNNESKEIKNIYIDCKPQNFLSSHGFFKIINE